MSTAGCTRSASDRIFLGAFLALGAAGPDTPVMAGSAAETPTHPDEQQDVRPPGAMRASDAERDAVVARLTEGFAAGRLSHDTFMYRMSAVLRTRHRADLPALHADLPATPPAPGRAAELLGRLRAAWPRRPRQAAPRPARPAPPVPLVFPRGDRGSFSIGRSGGCDLTIADMTVSRVHATLERTADGWLLTDLGSTNGTRLNGWRVRSQVPVRAGDVVSFGDAQYSLRAADGE
jgi:FHA domain/Domain of unknown function (DUF1707)